MGMTTVNSNSLKNVCGIYFIKEDREEDRIKIGKSTDIADRWSSHQTSNSDELTAIGHIECDEEKLGEVEKAAHIFFEDYKIRGEWFEITVEQAEKYISEQDKGILKIQKREDRSPKINTLEGFNSVMKYRPPCFINPSLKASGWDKARVGEPIRRIELDSGIWVPISLRSLNLIKQCRAFDSSSLRANRHTNGSKGATKNIKKTKMAKAKPGTNGTNNIMDHIND